MGAFVEQDRPAVGAQACGDPGPGDDFFCLRYQVWYPSFDCAIRTKFRTSAGCLDCDQGRFNYKRHRPALLQVRFPFPPVR